MRRYRKARDKPTGVQAVLINDDTVPPFKRSEKLYKKYQGHQTDFTKVIDFDYLEGNTEENKKRICTIPTNEDSIVHTIDGHEGLYILPRFLSEASQLEWARRCLEVLLKQVILYDFCDPVADQEYPEPPNLTNLKPHFGDVSGIWRGSCDGSASAAKMLQSLRWCTLGYQVRSRSLRHPHAGLHTRQSALKKTS
jgi:hypothetical protein